MRNRLLLAVFTVALSLSCIAEEKVLLVVSPDSPLSNLSLAKVRELYRCDKASLPGMSKVAVFTRTNGSVERTVMLRQILGMGEVEFKQYFVMKQMRGEGDCKVAELPSKGMVLEVLRGIPGAIALVRESDFHNLQMKAVAIDGHKFSDVEYPLH
jgi:hypothetical protein